ncbi:hypothetical protein NM688_g7046 [Phlebia brevispora]|uniref:Uncharacterized protein n=1 Tax=Phlebia brevispora TaxID=194682 RepID=A0ACC1S9N2_9APHY|nr:hypothetical protein NM688_g7046 [Phlebia brevispora]
MSPYDVRLNNVVTVFSSIVPLLWRARLKPGEEMAAHNRQQATAAVSPPSQSKTRADSAVGCLSDIAETSEMTRYVTDMQINTVATESLPKPAARYGAIPGILICAEFPIFGTMRIAGVHRGIRAGIVARKMTGVESVVLNGKYDNNDMEEVM